MKILNTIYWALFNMSFAALYCFYYAIPLTILTISIIALSSIILAFIEYKSHLYYIDNIGYLHNKVEENNIPEVLNIIEYGANINVTDCDGGTPLHLAAKYGHTQTAIALIERGADVNATDYDEATPLHLAIWKGKKEIAIALMDRGADVHAKNKRSWTPLHLAAQCGNKEIAIALIEHGADINAANIYGETPLHRAAIKGDTEIAIALIEHEANVNATKNYRETPLHRAAQYGHTEIAIALMDRGADVHAKDDDRSWTPLHWAAQYGQTETAIALIEHEANVNPTGCNGETPLHLATWNGQTEIAIALMDRGADVHAKNKRSWTPLHWAAFHRHVEIAISLIERGADIHATVPGRYNMYYRTPLHIIIEIHAAEFRNIEIPTIAMALIEHGANLPEDRSKLISIMEYLDWWTPLHTAIINNNLDEISTLEYTPSETSPLDLAVMIGNIDAVRALIERGIQYDKDKCLRTATYSNRHELAQLFLEKGANPLSKNKLGQTAFHFADARGNENIMKIFVDNIQNNSARSIQRGFRSYLFKNNKANSTQEPTPPPSLGSPTP
jgi:ankyrin repeat protein